MTERAQRWAALIIGGLSAGLCALVLALLFVLLLVPGFILRAVGTTLINVGRHIQRGLTLINRWLDFKIYP